MTQNKFLHGMHKGLPFVMWVLPLSFFALQFILRLWPGLMMQEIMGQFSIDAADFGLLAAFYYYGYAGMQIPMAFLLERFGAKRVIFTFTLLCGLGALLFTSTNNFYMALLSRFLIGASSAIGFLGVSKVVSQWFSNDNYSHMVGLSFSVGLLGAVYGGKPFTQLLTIYGSHSVGLGLALSSISIGLMVFFFLRTPKNVKNTPSDEIKLSHLSVLLTSKILWILAIGNLLMVGALEGFADVWGVPYLMMAFGFPKTDAALLVSFIFIGMLFGGPLLAFLSQRFGNYKILGLCGVGLALIFVVLLSGHVSHWWLLCILFFTIGLLCCYQVIVFATGANIVSKNYLGMTVAFLNCMNMLGGSFFHTLIGKIMDLYWNGDYTTSGLKQYTLSSYHHALMVIPACAVIGALLIYRLQKYARRQTAVHSEAHLISEAG